MVAVSGVSVLDSFTGSLRFSRGVAGTVEDKLWKSAGRCREVQPAAGPPCSGLQRSTAGLCND